MRLFSKFAFLCNCCFLIAMILRWVEMLKRSKGNFNGAIPFQPLESTLVVLGYSAILFNLIFCLWMIIRFLTKSGTALPKWMLWFNLLLLPAQVTFFFFMR